MGGVIAECVSSYISALSFYYFLDVLNDAKNCHLSLHRPVFINKKKGVGQQVNVIKMTHTKKYRCEVKFIRCMASADP